MKAGSNKENFLPPNAVDFTSPERKTVLKVLRFEQEHTPDRPIHRKIPSLVTKDYRTGLRHKHRGKKSMEIDRKSHDFRNSPLYSTAEMKSSLASTDIRGLSVFSSEVDSKKIEIPEVKYNDQSISEKLACESFCFNCQKYVYTKVTFSKNSEADFLCCVKELVGCCGEINGQEIHHLCSKCGKLIWKIGIDQE